MADQDSNRQTDIPDTLQSLLVAFALALAFRGFIIEGFVIPTGSMAPTLMGEHVRFSSPATGYEYAFDGSRSVLVRSVENGRANWRYDPVPIIDPMVSQVRPVVNQSPQSMASEVRTGDRVLVLKFLYEFFDPNRWDVVVFKNPTDPIGPAQNYIKRLVGLGGEQLLLADGDVFVSEPGKPVSEMKIVRMPDYIQNAVWQPVYNSDFVAGGAVSVARQIGARVPPFDATGFEIDSTRTWNTESGGTLTWNNDQIAIRDFNAYNFLRYSLQSNRGGQPAEFSLGAVIPVSDVRITGALEVENPETFSMSLQLTALEHGFVYSISDGKASLAMFDAEGAKLASTEKDFTPTGNMVVDVRNVDQRMSLRVDGDEIVRMDYDWSPMERLEHAYVDFDIVEYRREPYRMKRKETGLEWTFENSAVSLRSVTVDRDLYYKPGRLQPRQQARANGPVIEGLLFATDPLEPAVLEDDHFLMLGDNSDFSRDSRYLGRPHPLVVKYVEDDSPFVIHRDLLVGKAWCVYFPAPGRISSTGPAVVPDFGRLRFIR